MQSSPLWDHLGIGDEISLIKQLYETYGEESNVGTIVHISNQASDNYVQTAQDTCGFNNEETFKKFEKRGIFAPTEEQREYPRFDESLGANCYEPVSKLVSGHCEESSTWQSEFNSRSPRPSERPRDDF